MAANSNQQPWQQQAKAKEEATGTSGHQTGTGATGGQPRLPSTGAAASKGNGRYKRHQRAPDGHRINGGQPRLPGTGAAAGKAKAKATGTSGHQGSCPGSTEAISNYQKPI